MENDMTDTVVDKLLQEAIAKNRDLIADHKIHISALNSQVSILTKENEEYLAKYQELCPHTESTRETVSHMEGGYDHVSETQYRDICTRCGKVTGSKLVRGTYA